MFDSMLFITVSLIVAVVVIIFLFVVVLPWIVFILPLAIVAALLVALFKIFFSKD